MQWIHSGMQTMEAGEGKSRRAVSDVAHTSNCIYVFGIHTARALLFGIRVELVIGHMSNFLCPVAATHAFITARDSMPDLLFTFNDRKPCDKYW